MDVVLLLGEFEVWICFPNKANSAWNDWKWNEIGKIVFVKMLYCCSPADPKCKCTDCLSVYTCISLIIITCFTLNRIVKHCQLISAILKHVYHLRLKINNAQYIIYTWGYVDVGARKLK